MWFLGAFAFCSLLAILAISIFCALVYAASFFAGRKP